MERYDSYKDSGVKWLGEIPSHWEMKKIKHVIVKSKDGIKIGPFGSSLTGKVKDNGDYKVYGQWNIVGNDFSINRNFVDFETYNNLSAYQISAGDILVSMMGTVGKCSIIPKDIVPGIMDSHVVKIRLVEDIILPEYFVYLYDKDNSKIVYEQILKNRKGSIMDGLNSSLIKLLILPIPSIDEQKKMVAYLNVVTSKIDTAIAQQQKMIDLLNERKQIIINNAVTKGIDPSVPLKDSGLKWIGEIPSEWKIMKTLFVLSMPITDGPHETPQFYDEGIPFVSAEAVSCGNGNIDFDHIRGYISPSFYEECCKKYIPQRNDIYMIKSGATTGKVALVDTDRIFTIWSPLAVFRCNKNIMFYKFMFYLLQSGLYQTQVQLGWTYGTQQNIGMRTLEKLVIPVPSLEEQTKLSKYLDEAIGKIEKVKKNVEKTISLLQERKQIIINDVVTGKLKVL